MADIENDETTIKRICHWCIGEAYLTSEIRLAGDDAECDYCGENAPSIGSGELAERIEEAFADH